jgi:hypothetical protein
MEILLIIIGILILILLAYLAFFKKSDIPEIKQDDTGLEIDTAAAERGFAYCR